MTTHNIKSCIYTKHGAVQHCQINTLKLPQVNPDFLETGSFSVPPPSSQRFEMTQWTNMTQRFKF